MTTNTSSGFEVRIEVIDHQTSTRQVTRAFPSGPIQGSMSYSGAVELEGTAMHWVHVSMQRDDRARIVGGSKPAGEKHALASAYDKTIEVVACRATASYYVKERFEIIVTIAPREPKKPQISKAQAQRNQMAQLLERLKEDRPPQKPAKSEGGAMQKIGGFFRSLAGESEAPKQSRIVKLDERQVRRAAAPRRRV